MIRLTATSLLSLLANLRRPVAHHEQPLLLLPAPKQSTTLTVTASTWERERHPCPVCGEEMTKEIFSPRYFCLACDELVAKEAQEQLSKARMPVFRTGEFSKAVRKAQAKAGAYSRDMRRVWQDEAVKKVLSTLETQKNLKDAPEAKELINLKRPPTGPLPARDIVREDTPRIPANPATPLPETRESLFADVPDIPEQAEDEHIEDGMEITEKRRMVRRTTPTVEIPAIDAEVLLEAIMRGEMHEQSTGENERLPEKHWML